MSNDFINRRQIDGRRRNRGGPNQKVSGEFIAIPTFDTFYHFVSAESDRWNGFLPYPSQFSVPEESYQIPIGLMNPWNHADNINYPQDDGGPFGTLLAARTPTRAVLGFDLTGVPTAASIIDAKLMLTVAGNSAWDDALPLTSSSGVGGNNEVVIPTLDSGSLYQRYISPYRFWMSRDATSGQEFSTINISYQCLEPDDIKAELATGVQRYLLTPDNFLQRYLLDNWFGQPFVPGYGWDDPILRWTSPTGSGGKPVEHIITNPIYKPPSFPPVSTDPNPPSPRPPSPWWEDRDSFPADQFGPDYIPERELNPIDVDGTNICGRYFIDPTTGEYWFKTCENQYFTWHPEGFWVPWGSNTTNADFEDGFNIENPECVYRDNEEFIRQYLRGRSLEWFYDFIRNIRFAIEIGWLPTDFPIPSLQPASGEGVIITYPQYEYLINPRKD